MFKHLMYREPVTPLLACMAVSLCSGNSFMVSATLGACMASLSVQNIGNLTVSHESINQLLKKQLSNFMN